MQSILHTFMSDYFAIFNVAGNMSTVKLSQRQQNIYVTGWET